LLNCKVSRSFVVGKSDDDTHWAKALRFLSGVANGRQPMPISYV
jgi:hypothetical protein